MFLVFEYVSQFILKVSKPPNNSVSSIHWPWEPQKSWEVDIWHQFDKQLHYPTSFISLSHQQHFRAQLTGSRNCLALPEVRKEQRTEPLSLPLSFVTWLWDFSCEQTKDITMNVSLEWCSLNEIMLLSLYDNSPVTHCKHFWSYEPALRDH